MAVDPSMPVFPPNAGRPADAPWARAVSDHTIHRFNTTGERDALWPDPPDGAFSTTLTDRQTWRYDGVAEVWIQLSQTFAGEIRQGIFTVAPYGWLLMNGLSYAGANLLYPNLWAASPTSWRSGTTLTIPNMADRVLEGGGTRGALGGAMTHVLAGANLPPHPHTNNHDHPATATDSKTATIDFDIPARNGGALGTGSVARSNNAGASNPLEILTATELHFHTLNLPSFVGNTGNGPGASSPVTHNPAHLRVNYIIKT